MSRATSYTIYRSTSLKGTYGKIAATTARAYSSAGLSANTVYYYKVRAVNSKGEGNYSAAVSARTRTAAPTGLVASALGKSSIKLTWKAVSGATKYIVYRSASSAGPYAKAAEAAAAASPTYTNSGLSANKIYFYKVAAVNAAGESAQSAAAYAKTLTVPAAPANLKAAALSVGSIKLTWGAVSGATKYIVYRSASSAGPYAKAAEAAAAASPTYTNSGLSANKIYFYKVAAVNAAGESAQSAAAYAKTLTVPAAPANLNAAALSTGSIKLTWGAVSGATKYFVYRSVSPSGTYAKIAEAAAVSSPGYTNSGLVAGTDYYYKVSAVNAAGEGAQSAAASAKTMAVPAAPANLNAAALSTGSIKLTWGAVSGATKYFVYRSDSSSGTYSKIDEAVTNASPSYTDSGLAAGTDYYYKVSAVNAAGEGAQSAAASANTMALPAAPANLNAAALSTGSIKLTWGAVSGATKYFVYRSVSPSGTYAKIAEAAAASSPGYTNSGLAAGTDYYYKVSAVNAAGEGAQSAAASAKTMAVPAAPANLNAAALSTGSIKLTWGAVSGATKYFVYRSDSSSGTYSKIDEADTNASPSYTDSGLAAGTDYYYKVSAVNAAGEGAQSAPAHVKTPDSELERAVSLGIGSYAPDSAVTYEQFFGMLDAAVNAANPSAMSAWKAEFPDARASNNPMTRQEGMLAEYYAARALGGGYSAKNTEWAALNDRVNPQDDPDHTDWNRLTYNYPLFPGWDQPAVFDNHTWDTAMVAAFFYSMGRASLYSDKIVFDYDAAANSMRPGQPFTHDEALRAALRLYESGMDETDRVPTEQDAAILKKADERRSAILNSPTDVTVTGAAYYVSNTGSDDNDGKTPGTAWATIGKVNSAQLSPGDGVFFERGGVFRGVPSYRSNITYSAYGTGPKPRIYGSPEDGADPAKWTLLEGTTNIWVFHRDMYDTSCIVMDDGDRWATRKTGLWDGEKYVDLADPSTAIGPKDLADMEFFNPIDYAGCTTEQAHISLDRKGKIYLRCDEGNPGAVFQSIEFCSIAWNYENGGGWALIRTGASCVVDNLCVMYTNQNGLGVEGDTVVQNCEVAWCGGAVLNFNGAWLGSDQTAVIRGGDGICLMNGSGGAAINNYIHHISDYAITNELGNGMADAERCSKDKTIKGNLGEYCSGGILICDWEALQANREDLTLFENIDVEDNYMMFGGYGWSHLTPEYNWGTMQPRNNGDCSLNFGFPAKSGKDITVRNNVFYLNRYSLIGTAEGAGGQSQRYQISFEGNTYAQNTLGLLARYPALENFTRATAYHFNINAPQVVSDILGDKTGTVLTP